MCQLQYKNTNFECIYKNTNVSKDDKMTFNKLVEFYLPEINNQVAKTKLKMWQTKISKNFANTLTNIFTEND